MRIALDDGELPPKSCEDCHLGPLTIYGPTAKTSPELVCAQRREIQHFAPGRTLVREGETSESVHVLYSGWAFCYKQLPDGRRQILSFLLPGDTMVLESLCFPHLSLPFSIMTLTAITCCTFAGDDLAALMRVSPEQKDEFARTRRRYAASVHERLFDLGRRTARGRLAQLLLELQERLSRRNMVDANGGFAFPARQEHLADALGLTTVYVNRTLALLRREGIVVTENKRVTIHDLAALRRTAIEE